MHHGIGVRAVTRSADLASCVAQNAQAKTWHRSGAPALDTPSMLRVSFLPQTTFLGAAAVVQLAWVPA